MRAGCTKPAVGAIGIALYPPAAVMRFHRTTQWLTRLILGLEECAEHRAATIAAGPFELMPRDKLAPIARLCERSSGTKVDLEASKVVAVAFDDPDYQVLMRQRPGEKPPC
jgi:hypothetical protein